MPTVLVPWEKPEQASGEEQGVQEQVDSLFFYFCQIYGQYWCIYCGR